MKHSIGTQQSLDVQLRQDLIPMLPAFWVSADEAFERVRLQRNDNPFIASGSVQLTRSLMHASFLFSLNSHLNEDQCCWRRRYDVDEMVLPCAVVLRVNKVDLHGNRSSNSTRRCVTIHQGALIPEAVQGVSGFATLGYVLDFMESRVAMLKISWTSGSGERIIWTPERPDEIISDATNVSPADPDDIVVELK
jgi:hypothetical protein